MLLLGEGYLSVRLELSLLPSQIDKTKIDFQALRIQSNIPQETQVTIYRIVQELLANAIRHANPKNILLQCSQNKNRFFITVEDDGKGFDITISHMLFQFVTIYMLHVLLWLQFQNRDDSSD